MLEPHLGEAVDQVIAGAARLPQVAEIYRKHPASSVASKSRNIRNC